MGHFESKKFLWQTFYSFFRNKVFTLMLDEMTPGQNALIFAIFLEIQNIQLQWNIVWIEQFCIKFHKNKLIFIAMNSLFAEQYNFTRSFHQSLTSQFCNFLVQNCPLWQMCLCPPVTTYIHTYKTKLHPPRKRIYNKYCFSSLKKYDNNAIVWHHLKFLLHFWASCFFSVYVLHLLIFTSANPFWLKNYIAIWHWTFFNYNEYALLYYIALVVFFLTKFEHF